MQEPEPPIIQPFVFVFSWRRFVVHCAIMGFCIFLGVMTWYFGKPASIRFYETKAENQLTATISPSIDMTLNTESTVTIKEETPLRAELFRGSVYFDMKKEAIEKLEVKVGDAIIKNLGTRFSIEKHNDGSNHVAVADGYIKVHVASGVFQINAFEEANFDDTHVTRHRLIIDRDIAPWRHSTKTSTNRSTNTTNN